MFAVNFFIKRSVVVKVFDFVEVVVPALALALVSIFEFFAFRVHARALLQFHFRIFGFCLNEGYTLQLTDTNLLQVSSCISLCPGL